MAFIYETPNFIVESREQPFVSREEGGHVRIIAKDSKITDRTKLNPLRAVELMRLSMIVGKALEVAMNNRGIKVVKVNYHDMGNWSYKENKKPVFHYHVFGRVLGAKNQPFPESVYLPDRSTGFYKDFIPLNEGDIREIKNQIETISKEGQFILEKWSLDEK